MNISTARGERSWLLRPKEDQKWSEGLWIDYVDFFDD